MIHPELKISQVTGISEDEEALIRAYLQSAVYIWVREHEGKKFTARDLVSDTNFQWKGSPLLILYLKYIKTQSEEAADEAASKDLECLLRSVLTENKRNFKVEHSGENAKYSWQETDS